LKVPKKPERTYLYGGDMSEERTVRIVKKSPEEILVTIGNKVFATFRGDDAIDDAIACADSLVK